MGEVRLDQAALRSLLSRAFVSGWEGGALRAVGRSVVRSNDETVNALVAEVPVENVPGAYYTRASLRPLLEEAARFAMGREEEPSTIASRILGGLPNGLLDPDLHSWACKIVRMARLEPDLTMESVVYQSTVREPVETPAKPAPAPALKFEDPVRDVTMSIGGSTFALAVRWHVTRACFVFYVNGREHVDRELTIAKHFVITNKLADKLVEAESQLATVRADRDREHDRRRDLIEAVLGTVETGRRSFEEWHNEAMGVAQRTAERRAARGRLTAAEQAVMTRSLEFMQGVNTTTFSFAEALVRMRAGKSVKRAVWTEKAQGWYMKDEAIWTRYGGDKRVREILAGHALATDWIEVEEVCTPPKNDSPFIAEKVVDLVSFLLQAAETTSEVNDVRGVRFHFERGTYLIAPSRLAWNAGNIKRTTDATAAAKILLGYLLLDPSQWPAS